MWWYQGENALSWERIVREKEKWIGRDLTIDARSVFWRGPISDITVEDNEQGALSTKSVLVHLAWCAAKNMVGEADPAWRPADHPYFVINVTERFDRHNMYVDAAGGVDLYLWLVSGYRIMPSGDNMTQPSFPQALATRSA